MVENIHAVEAETESGIWSLSQPELFNELLNAELDSERLRKVLLVAEVAPFTSDQILSLLEGLTRYIEYHRFCDSPELKVAVGSAIRKFAMNMGESDFKTYATWLIPSNTEFLSHEIELEFVKSAVWRLSASPLLQQHDTLATTLEALASDYLSPRLLLQKNYASTAIQAVVGTLILDTYSEDQSRSKPLVQKINALSLTWIKELIVDAILEAIEVIETHSQNIAKQLKTCAEAIQQ